MKRVVVPLATGFEELEAVTIIDLLRRAGIDVTVVGLQEGPVTGSRGTRLLPDIVLGAEIDSDYDMLILPGGLPGADNLKADTRVIELIKQMDASNRYIAAICAAPGVLASAGVLKDKNVTSFPGALEEFAAQGIESTGLATVIDGNVITSRGPGTAMDFSLELIRLLVGEDARRQVEENLQR